MALTQSLEKRIEESKSLQERIQQLMGTGSSNAQPKRQFEELNKVVNGVTKYLRTVSQVPFDYGVRVNKKTKQAVFSYDLRLHETYRALNDIDASLAVSDELRENKTPLRYSIRKEGTEHGSENRQINEAEDILAGVGYSLALDTAEKLLDLNRQTIDTYIDQAICDYDTGDEGKDFPELMKANILKTLGKQGSYAMLERAQEYLDERSPYLSEDESVRYAKRIEEVATKQHDTMLEALRLFSMTVQKQDRKDYPALMDDLHAQFVTQHLPKGEMDDDDQAYHDWVRGGQHRHYDPQNSSGLTSAAYAKRKLSELRENINHPEQKNHEYYKSLL
jgi:hypothetical protein